MSESQCTDFSGLRLSDPGEAEHTMFDESSNDSNSCESSPLQLYDVSVYENEHLSLTPLYDGAKVTVMNALVKHRH